MKESEHRAPHEEPLELDLPERPAAPPPQMESPEPQSRPGRNLALLAAVVLCAAAIVLYFVVHRPGPPDDSSGSTAASATTDDATRNAAAPEKLAVPDDSAGAPSLTVTSDPAGATVFVGGEEAGRTPLLGTNEFGKGTDVPIRLELPGYRPWSGTFRGGANASVRAKLKRK